MKILVVDDDRALLRSLEVLLTQRGHEVECIDDPLRAGGRVKAFRGDVLVVDLTMPGASGLDLVKDLPQQPSHPKVLLVSGHTDQVSELDLAAHGIAAFLPKPLDLEHLIEHVESTPPVPSTGEPKIVGESK